MEVLVFDTDIIDHHHHHHQQQQQQQREDDDVDGDDDDNNKFLRQRMFFRWNESRVSPTNMKLGVNV
jgi:hypothetical protein